MKRLEDIIFDEETKELNLKERFIVKLFPKTFKKVFRTGMIKCFNYYNK